VPIALESRTAERDLGANEYHMIGRFTDGPLWNMMANITIDHSRKISLKGTFIQSLPATAQQFFKAKNDPSAMLELMG